MVLELESIMIYISNGQAFDVSLECERTNTLNLELESVVVVLSIIFETMQSLLTMIFEIGQPKILKPEMATANLDPWTMNKVPLAKSATLWKILMDVSSVLNNSSIGIPETLSKTEFEIDYNCTCSWIDILEQDSLLCPCFLALCPT